MLFPITDNVPFITNHVHVARTTCAVIDLRNSKDIPIETYAPFAFTYHSFVARYHPWRRDTAVKNRPSVSGLYGLYAVVFTRPRDLPTFFLSLSLSLSDARSNPPSFSPNISSNYPPIKRPRVEEIDSIEREPVGRGWTARLESVNERDRDPAPQRPRHGRVGEERCRVARWSSITWAAHAEIDGSTCIRDNAPCRTGCSVG